MKISEPRDRTQQLIRQLTEVWESSVRATHLFLSGAEIEEIKKYVPQAIEQVPHLRVAADDSLMPVAFTGIGEKMEMLFVGADKGGNGLGRKLLLYGIEKYGVKELAVNEQNPQALDFYRHMGFRVYKRTEYDEQEQPYPLLYMKLEIPAEDEGGAG